MNEGAVLRKRHNIARKMPNVEECIRGSLVIMRRSCGKSNCHCLKGQKHKAIYISQSYAGKTRMFYIPQRSEQKAHQHIKNYQKIRDILNRLSDINIKLLTKI
jgi:arginine/lysine/ornithine decarboxylase